MSRRSQVFDSKYNYRRQITLQKEARTTRQGIYYGGKLVGGGIASGVAGLVRQPVKGAREAGARGFAKGVGKGTVALVPKMAAGLTAGVSKIAEGVASDVRHLTGSSEDQSTLRVRQPRELSTTEDGAPAVLLPYPRFRIME